MIEDSNTWFLNLENNYHIIRLQGVFYSLKRNAFDVVSKLEEGILIEITDKKGIIDIATEEEANYFPGSDRKIKPQ